MKRFVFTLERMLVYQQQNLEKEKGVLGRLTAVRDELEERKRDSESIIRHIQEDIGRRQAQGTTVFILKGCHSVLEGARIQMEETADEKKLEKLKEKQLEEYRHDEAKEQQDLITEHVAGEFVRNGVS